MNKNLYHISEPSENEEYNPNLLAYAILDRKNGYAYWKIWGVDGDVYTSFERNSAEHEEAKDELHDFIDDEWMFDGERYEAIIPYTQESLEKLIEKFG